MRFLRILFAVFILSASLVSGSIPVSAQETIATSTLSGLVVDIGTSGDGSFVDTSPEPYDDWGYLQEDFLIIMDKGEIHISFAQGDVTTESWFTDSHQNLAQEFDAYSVLDEAVEPEQGWALTRETYWLHYDLVTYFEFYFEDVSDVSLGVAIHTTDANIIEYVEWTQQNILIGGDPVGMLAEVDHLEPLVSGTASIEPRQIPGFTSSVADWEAQGLLSETEWMSPNNETSISWDETYWQFPFHRNNAIATDSATTEDVITLVTPDGNGHAFVYASANPPGYSPQDWENWWSSDEYMAGMLGANNEIASLVDHASTDTTAGAIIYFVNDFGHAFVTITDVYIDDSGTAVTVFLTATPDDIANVYADYWDGVQSNGDFYPLTWSIEEIQAIEID